MDFAAQSNAFFNQFWLGVSNHCEKEAYSQKVDYYVGEQEGLVVHHADLQNEILKSRTEAFFVLNLLQDRRPERYEAVLDQSRRFPTEALKRGVAAPPEMELDRRPRLVRPA